MDNELIFKILAVGSPFVSAALASFLTYKFSIKTKKTEYLYQNRIPAFKEVALKLIELKKYCLGKVAIQEGNEFSPFYDLEGSGLHFRSEIANTIELNAVFLSEQSIKLLESLDGKLAFLCNAELMISGSTNDKDIKMYSTIYGDVLDSVENCLKVLYKELELPK